ncbi:MAG: Hsp70 family protein [Terricaulis sp.]
MAEQAKKELSTVADYDVNIPFIGQDPNSKLPLHLNMKLTRAKLESLVDDLINRRSARASGAKGCRAFGQRHPRSRARRRHDPPCPESAAGREGILRPRTAQGRQSR